jgi:hypothetical protein
MNRVALVLDFAFPIVVGYLTENGALVKLNLKLTRPDLRNKC